MTAAERGPDLLKDVLTSCSCSGRRGREIFHGKILIRRSFRTVGKGEVSAEPIAVECTTRREAVRDKRARPSSSLALVFACKDEQKAAEGSCQARCAVNKHSDVNAACSDNVTHPPRINCSTTLHLPV